MMGFCTLPARALRVLGIGAIAVGLTPAIALAHGANIQARSASAVEILAAYDTGEPMAAAQVQVFAPDDPQTPAFTGTTDTAGRFVFMPDQAGNWEVSVRQAGHGDIAVVPVDEAGMATLDFSNSSGLTWPQKIIVAGAVTWGCIGTALYFRRGKR